MSHGSRPLFFWVSKQCYNNHSVTFLALFVRKQYSYVNFTYPKALVHRLKCVKANQETINFFTNALYVCAPQSHTRSPFQRAQYKGVNGRIPGRTCSVSAVHPEFQRPLCSSAPQEGRESPAAHPGRHWKKSDNETVFTATPSKSVKIKLTPAKPNPF